MMMTYLVVAAAAGSFPIIEMITDCKGLKRIRRASPYFCGF
jgi:hypothetical protein